MDDLSTLGPLALGLLAWALGLAALMTRRTDCAPPVWGAAPPLWFLEPWRSTPRHGSVPDIRSETNGGEKDCPGNAARDGGPAGVSGGREGSGVAGSGMGRGRPVRGGAALGPVRPGDDPPGGGMVWRPVLVRRRRSTGQAGKPPSSVRRGPVGSDLRPVCQSVAPAVEHPGPRSADGNSNGGWPGMEVYPVGDPPCWGSVSCG